MPRPSTFAPAAPLLAAVAAAAFALPLAAQAPDQANQIESVVTEAGPIAVQDITGGLERPWGMAFLPDGRLLVTERTGSLRIVTREGRVSAALGGTPVVYAQGQGGLQDVALDPDFAANGFVYLSYAAPGPEGSAATAVGRGRWQNDSINDFTVLFRQEPWITGPNHFGSRIAFGPQGHLFLAMGERFQFEPAQDPSNHLGTIIRIHRDGTVPSDNPFVGRAGMQDEIWSYGHRNIESAAINPATGALWVAEMGPLGGDELNVPQPGRNYGWPTVSWGMHYDGRDIPDPPTRPEFADALHRWTPVISPAGMVFYTGDVFPAWRGSALIGSLSRHGVVRLANDGQRVTGEEMIPLPARIRDVEQGPDGMVYVLTDQTDGHLWRLAPLTPPAGGGN